MASLSDPKYENNGPGGQSWSGWLSEVGATFIQCLGSGILVLGFVLFILLAGWVFIDTLPQSLWVVGGLFAIAAIGYITRLVTNG